MGEKSGSGARELWRLVKFGLFSASAGGIQAGLFYLLGLIPSIGYWASYLPSLVASVVWNFTFNRRFTFQSAANIPRAMLKTFAYYAVFTPLSTILGNWLVETRFAGAPSIRDIVFAATLAANFVTEYLYQRFYVFRGRMDDRAAGSGG